MKTRQILLDPMRKQPAKGKVPFSKYFCNVFNTGRHAYESSQRLNAESSANIANFLFDTSSRLRKVNSISLFLAPFPMMNTLEHYVTLEGLSGRKTVSFDSHELGFIDDSIIGQAIKTNLGGRGFFIDEKKGRIEVFSLSKDDFRIGRIKTDKLNNGNQFMVIPLGASDSDRVRGCLIISGKDLRLKDRFFMLTSLTFLVTSSHSLYSIIKGQLDPLTKLINRDTMMDSLFFNAQRYLEDPSNPQNNFSLVAADLDDFKGINESQGHQKGDQVLREVASVLQRSVRCVQLEYGAENKAPNRSNDIVGRFSDKGDEFGAILPATGVPGALVVASRFLNNTRNTLTHSPGKPLTCSFGVVDAVTVHHLLNYPPIKENISSIASELRHIVPDYDQLPNLEKFVEAMRYVAEKARAHAKKEGKGRVVYPPILNPSEIGKMKFVTHTS